MLAAQHHAVQQIVDAVERRAPAKNFQLIDRFPAQKSGQQSTQSQNMIQMPVREQNARQAFETSARLQDLALCALPTVHEETVFIVADDGSRKSTLGRRRGSGSSKEKNFEHELSFVSAKLVEKKVRKRGVDGVAVHTPFSESLMTTIVCA